MSNAFTRVVHDDAAENSIMQTITIAVSAILIAAGLVTAPGLINNARDNNATTDLANSALAEESLLAADGKYWVYDNFNASQYRQMEKPAIEGSVNFTPSAKSRLIIETTDDGKKWVATSYSTSGKVFARSSESAKTTQLSDANFSSFSSVLAGEKIVLANASPKGSDLIIPEGITVATVSNMYEASVEEEPYDFTRAATRTADLPGEGIPTAAAATPSNPAPTSPAPAPAPVPSGPTTFNFSDNNDTKTNISMSDNYNGKSAWTTQTYFKTGTQTDTTADKSISQNYGTINKSTSWTINNASVVFTDSAGKKVNAPLGSFRYTEFTVNGNSNVYTQIDLVNPQFDRTSYTYFYFTSFVLTLDGKHSFNFNIEEF